MFPLKTLTLYKIKKNLISPRSEDLFEKNRQLTYIKSTLNHYEGIEICTFKDFDDGKILTWHADEMALEKWHEYFEIIPFPK